MSQSKNAFVTLVTSDAYAMGALVLAHSLRENGTAAQLVVMVTPDGVSPAVRTLLDETFDLVEEVNPLDSNDHANLSLLARPDLGVTFTKLHCWRLTQFEKAVFIDADALILKNVDDLFEYEELSASPDPGWPDCFNSGVFVFRPNEETYARLLKFALEHGSFDGGDQGLLNEFFSSWVRDSQRRLPFVYNCVAQTFYSYAPAFAKFRDQIRVVHFIGSVKPWHYSVNPSNGQIITKDVSIAGHSTDHLQLWWNIFLKYVISSMAKNSDFLSSYSCSLPGGMYRLIVEIIQIIKSRRHGESAETVERCSQSGYEWYFSGRWFGERHGDSSVLGFPFLQIHRPRFETVVDHSFLHVDHHTHVTTTTTTQVVPSGTSREPIVRYFITIGDDDQSHIDVVSPDDWRRMMHEEGLLDEEEELDEEEYGWASGENVHGRLARLVLPHVDPSTSAPIPAAERDRQYAWERNEIDYTGSDRFDAILNKINAAINPPP